MFNKIKIRVVSNILGAVIFTMAGFFYFLAENTKSEIALVDTAWQQYQSSRSEKARYESSLRSAIGYGGVIHEFKNFVLRKDISTLDNLQSRIGAAQLVLAQYRSLDINGAETIALHDIETVLSAYNRAATKISGMIEQGILSAEEIDAVVRINDAPAFRGLEILAQEVFEHTVSHDNFDSLSNGRLVALLRAHIGYGGVIHHFKNYVLRQEPELIPLFQESIKRADEIVAEYQSRLITNTEQVALHDISETLNYYRLAFQKAQELSTSAEEIDAAVRIADAPALRSLALLDKEVVALTERNAIEVQRNLHEISRYLDFASILGFSVAVLVVLIVVFSIRRFVLRPIESLTDEMMELATGHEDFQISGVEFDNEIGDMARAVVVFQQNLKKLTLAEASVRALAMTDPLTGLANRNHFDLRLKETISLINRLEIGGALLAIDLDGFKAINDTYGHGAGDYVLKVISGRFKNVSREIDIIARMGGDEFAMVTVAIEERNQILPLVERVVSESARPIIYEENKLQVTASVGVSFIPDQGDTAEVLSKKADIALYQAKEKGKNQFVLFDDSEQKTISS